MLRSLIGKVQDKVTQAVYGIEKQTAKMSFYSCVDRNMDGKEVKVRDDDDLFWIQLDEFWIFHLVGAHFGRCTNRCRSFKARSYSP